MLAGLVDITVLTRLYEFSDISSNPWPPNSIFVVLSTFCQSLVALADLLDHVVSHAERNDDLVSMSQNYIQLTQGTILMEIWFCS